MDVSDYVKSSARVLLKMMPEKSKKAVNILRSVKWKNEVAAKHEAYKPTKVEHLANIFTHAFTIPIALWWSYELLHLSSNQTQTTSALIYGAVLIGLFTVSTIFHTFSCTGKHETLRELFHRGDRAMIYLFIAGSYTPWLRLSHLPHGGFAYNLRWGIWPIASLGIVYQQLFHEKYKWLETIFYLVIGIIPGLLASMEMYDERGLFELKLGGAVYVVGVIFFKCDGRIPLAHAIWHLFVVAGSTIHYFAVLEYLYGDDGSSGQTLGQSIVDVEMAAPKLIHSEL